jgi:hypothetical protein
MSPMRPGLPLPFPGALPADGGRAGAAVLGGAAVAAVALGFSAAGDGVEGAAALVAAADGWGVVEVAREGGADGPRGAAVSGIRLVAAPGASVV